jgi:hypothetical protein
MARPEVHAAMADLALAGQVAAEHDDVAESYDRAWSAHLTARHHAGHALMAGQRALDERRAATIAGGKPVRFIETRVDGHRVQMTEQRYHELLADKFAWVAENHRDAAAKHEERGAFHMETAAAVKASLDEKEIAAVSTAREVGQQEAAANPSARSIRERKLNYRRGMM